MFAPPPNFANLKALLWAGPVCTGLGALALCAALATPTGLMWGVVLATSVLGFTGSLLAVWRSRFGVRHGWITSVVVFLTVCLPVSLVLVGAVFGSGQTLLGVAAVTVFHTCLLGASVIWNVRRWGPVPVPEGNRPIRWAGLLIDAERRTWRKASASIGPGSAQKTVAPFVIGSLSVVLHGSLVAFFHSDIVAAGAFVVGNVLSAWLCAWPLARTLAGAKGLAAWQRTHGELEHVSLKDLDTERDMSWLGRALRSRPIAAESVGLRTDRCDLK